MRNDMPMYDAKVIDNYGTILCRRTRVNWLTAINWCLIAADDWGFGWSTTVLSDLQESSVAKFCHEEISEIRIDKHK